jgi:hypothetical protein
LRLTTQPVLAMKPVTVSAMATRAKAARGKDRVAKN